MSLTATVLLYCVPLLYDFTNEYNITRRVHGFLYVVRHGLDHVTRLYTMLHVWGIHSAWTSFSPWHPIEEGYLLPETILAAQFIPPGINAAHLTRHHSSCAEGARRQSVLLKLVACFLAISLDTQAANCL